jgi:hypothetical protein
MVERTAIAKQPLALTVPELGFAMVRRDIAYCLTDNGPLVMDLYYPREPVDGSRLPGVVLVIGYSDIGARKVFGCPFKEIESFIGWSRLIAASGMVAVIGETGNDPPADARALLAHVRENAGDLGIDADRIGLWACSGHVPTALSLLMDAAGTPCRSAALLYGYALDSAASTAVADAAAKFHFANPTEGKSVLDLPRDTELYVVRAGGDEMPALNESRDRFVADALRRNLSVTLVNHPTGAHAFDLFDNSEASKRIIGDVLLFLRRSLLSQDSS